MKLALFFAFIIASVNAIAQQAPGAVTKPSIGISKSVPLMAPPIAVVPPLVPPPSNKELTELLQAQTTAIKSLSNKLDSLEERIGKIERGQR